MRVNAMPRPRDHFDSSDVAPHLSPMHPATRDSDPLLTEFRSLRMGGVQALVRRGYESLADRLGLSGPPATAVGSVGGGREPHPVVELDGGERAVVRAYRRGGMIRHWNRARYFLGDRAVAELRASERARAGGVRTPEVLAAVRRRRPIGYEASLATRWIPDAVESAAWMRSAAAGARERMLCEAGRQIRLMHEAGVGHPDLNLRNLLVLPDEAVMLLDFDRARLHPGPVPRRRRTRDLRRLERSARKLAAPIDDRGWSALREGYGAGWPLAAERG